MDLPSRGKLEQRIQQFLQEYAGDFQLLVRFLQQAGISHYSSGCGPKSVAFDLFPAGEQVIKLMELLSLDRPYRAHSVCGLRDYSGQDSYNPAAHFMQYLKRWSGYADTVMSREGDSQRGVAAANAKVILDSLFVRLERKYWLPKSLLPKSRSGLSDFACLMQDIGLALRSRQEQKPDQLGDNHHRAMAAALRHIDA